MYIFEVLCCVSLLKETDCVPTNKPIPRPGWNCSKHSLRHLLCSDWLKVVPGQHHLPAIWANQTELLKLSLDGVCWKAVYFAPNRHHVPRDTSNVCWVRLLTIHTIHHAQLSLYWLFVCFQQEAAPQGAFSGPLPLYPGPEAWLWPDSTPLPGGESSAWCWGRGVVKVNMSANRTVWNLGLGLPRVPPPLLKVKWRRTVAGPNRTNNPPEMGFWHRGRRRDLQEASRIGSLRPAGTAWALRVWWVL